MTMYPSSSTQQPAAICALKSPADAIHILEAVRLGIVPRVTRRLTGHERSMIRPGTVWVWEEEETNMRRWTDGRRWGASRVGGGGFLVYTESSDSLSPPPSRPDSPTYSQYYGNGRDSGGPTPPRRPEPLVKQTYSTSMTHPVTGKIKKFHVVAYSSKRNPQGDGANPLPLPHQLPNLASIKITPGIWPDWETRRDDYNSRRTGSAPHASQVVVPPPHPHPHAAPPHHIPVGPGTPVTATAIPGPPPPDQYGRPGSPGSAYPGPLPMPPAADGRGPPMEAPHPHDRRYPPYPYDGYDRPPYPYDMYPPPPDRYYDRYPPYYPHPRDVPPAHMAPPPDYRYDERYYDRERDMAPRDPRDPRDLPPRDPRDLPSRDPRDPRDPRELPPRDPREMTPRDPRDPRDPREMPPRDPSVRPDEREIHARYYPPPPPHGYYRDPRDFRDPRDMPPRDPRDPRDMRDPRDPREVMPPHDPRDADPRDFRDPRDPRDYRDPRDAYPGPPREGSYPPRPTSSHLGKRTPESRPGDELAPPPEKRVPSWSPRGGAPVPPRNVGPPLGPPHMRNGSNGSYNSAADRERDSRPSPPRDGRDSREASEHASARRSRSPSRTYSNGVKGGSNGAALPPLRDSAADEPEGPRGAERDAREVAWGRVPA